jgi:L-alanine-DL-glutamate epimerase-like enolase superfamily enzyme
MQRRQFFKAATLLPGSLGLPMNAAQTQLQKQMKITGLETDLLQRPVRPGGGYSDAIRTYGTVDGGSVVIRILTDAGITGWASAGLGPIPNSGRVLQALLEYEIKPLIVGKDPAFPKRIRSDMYKVLEVHGVQGIVQYAMSSVDVALWDILGKAAGLPVYKLLGGFRERMPVYAMGGWYYPDDRDLSQFRRAANDAMEQGYHGFKVKVGRDSLDDDIQRIRVAQDIAGKNRLIMVDANQVFSRAEALLRGRVYQQMGCFWYEEPLPPYDVDGYAQLAGELDIRIATGENLYTKFAFATYIEHHALDVVQPDPGRSGGVTEWMEIAAVADAFGLQVASHGAGSGARTLNMLLAMPNAIYQETSGPQPNMVNGEVPGPEEPGMSTELPKETIAKFKVG